MFQVAFIALKLTLKVISHVKILPETADLSAKNVDDVAAVYATYAKRF